MKKGELKLYKCECCGKEFPHKISYWKKLSAPINGNCWHTTCRLCENNQIIKENVKEENGIKYYKCSVCKEWLTADNFDQAGGNKYQYRDGLDKRCHNCKLKQNKQARANYSDEKRLEKVLQDRWFGARDRAKYKDRLFNISKEDLIDLWNKQEGKCAISKIPMTFNMDSGRNPYNVSVDQIDPAKGYTKDNIQLVCMCVNQLKSDFNMEIIINVCKSILNNYETE